MSAPQGEKEVILPMQKMSQKIWDKFKQRLKERWDGLSDSDMDPYREDLSSLSARIQSTYGDSREVVQGFIDNLWFEIFVRGTKNNFTLNNLQSRLSGGSQSPAAAH